MYVSKEYITDGASVYMRHEGSHSSDVNNTCSRTVGMGEGRARL